MSKKQQQTENSTKKFSFTAAVLNQLQQDCSSLSDFVHTTFLNCRKLSKNTTIIDDALRPIYTEGMRLSKLDENLSQEARKIVTEPDGKANMDPMDLAIKRQELDAEKQTFNEKLWDVTLYTMKEDEFPHDKDAREKFGKKAVNTSNGQSFEVDLMTAFNNLTKAGIVIETLL